MSEMAGGHGSEIATYVKPRLKSKDTPDGSASSLERVNLLQVKLAAPATGASAILFIQVSARQRRASAVQMCYVHSLLPGQVLKAGAEAGARLVTFSGQGSGGNGMSRADKPTQWGRWVAKEGPCPVFFARPRLPPTPASMYAGEEPPTNWPRAQSALEKRRHTQIARTGAGARYASSVAD